jgi:UDP-glucose 4-epimerase
MNCGYGHGYSVMQVLDAVDRVTNIKLVRNMEGRRAGDPDALISDNKAIIDRFGWKPKYDDLDVIVQHALAWERRLSDCQDG